MCTKSVTHLSKLIMLCLALITDSNLWNPPPHTHTDTPAAALSKFTRTNSPLSISNAAWLQHCKHWSSHRVQAVLSLGSHFQEKKRPKHVLHNHMPEISGSQLLHHRSPPPLTINGFDSEATFMPIRCRLCYFPALYSN